MTRRLALVTFVLSMLGAFPVWAAPPSANHGSCTDVPLSLIVAPQVQGQGGISGDGHSIYSNPGDPFDGGTQYIDGVGGAYVRFQICNGTNDFILNLRSTKSPVRYLTLDFSARLAPADTINGAVDLTGRQLQQQGQQINEMANSSLYSRGQFVTCSGMMLNPLSPIVTGGNAWFQPTTTYDPPAPVLGCNGGTGPDIANQPTNTSVVQVIELNSCTWTVSALLDSSDFYRAGVAEVVTTGKRTSSWVAGGQYQMPFNYEIQRLNCIAP